MTRRRPEAGAAALEFALVVPLLLMLVFGLIEVGRAMWLHQAVTASSREGARFGIGNQNNDGTPQYLDCDGIRGAARSRTPDLVLSDADIGITYLHEDGTTSSCDDSPAPTINDGDRIVVTVAAELDVIMPLIPIGPVTLTATDSRSVYTGVSP
jgi:Flp pilus assembly protein TadG